MNIKKSAPFCARANGINQWADRHSVEHATVQAIEWLTPAPDRFSAAQFSPLLEHEKSSTQIINLLVWSGLCGWINRLKIALGEYIYLAASDRLRKTVSRSNGHQK